MAVHPFPAISCFRLLGFSEPIPEMAVTEVAKRETPNVGETHADVIHIEDLY
jgi:hypothetical protein